MKLIQLTVILLLSAFSSFAQENGSYPFENQLIFERVDNGQIQEYPKVTLMIGSKNYVGARVVSEEDAGAQYMLCDFNTNVYLILMRQFGQKIAIESPVDPSKIDVLGINEVKAVENKKVKKEILGEKCRVFEGEKDGQQVQIYIGKLSVPAKGLETLTKTITKEVGIDLNEGEMLLGLKFTNTSNNQVMTVEAKKVVNKKYNLSTIGYNKMSTSGFGF